MQNLNPNSLNGPLRESERTLLQLIRDRGPLSKAELARISGMSAQGVAVIMDGLIGSGIVLKGVKQRGRVGQPSTPLTINPEGAFSIGLHVGNGRMIGSLVDFAGNTLERRIVTNDLPPDEVDDKGAIDLVETLIGALGEALRDRMIGICIVTRDELMAKCGDPRMSVERRLVSMSGKTLQSELQRHFGLRVMCENETRAGAIAELRSAPEIAERGLYYIRLGCNVDSALALNGRLMGDIGAPQGQLGTLPLCEERGCLNDVASVRVLDKKLVEGGTSLSTALEIGFTRPQETDIVDRWAEEVKEDLALAAVCATAAVPIEVLVFEGPLPSATLEKFAKASEKACAELNRRLEVSARVGSFGMDAPSIGAALLPLQYLFAPDPSLFAPKRTQRAA